MMTKTITKIIHRFFRFLQKKKFLRKWKQMSEMLAIQCYVYWWNNVKLSRHIAITKAEHCGSDPSLEPHVPTLALPCSNSGQSRSTFGPTRSDSTQTEFWRTTWSNSGLTWSNSGSHLDPIWDKQRCNLQSVVSNLKPTKLVQLRKTFFHSFTTVFGTLRLELSAEHRFRVAAGIVLRARPWISCLYHRSSAPVGDRYQSILHDIASPRTKERKRRRVETRPIGHLFPIPRRRTIHN